MRLKEAQLREAALAAKVSSRFFLLLYLVCFVVVGYLL